MNPAVQVPPLSMRQRVPSQAIEEVVRQIVTQFQPQQIILFVLMLPAGPGLRVMWIC